MTEAQSQSEVTAEPTPPCFVGIEVAKAWLDVGVRPSGAHWRVANAEAELPALVARLRTRPPSWSCWRRPAGTSAVRWRHWRRLVCRSW